MSDDPTRREALLAIGGVSTAMTTALAAAQDNPPVPQRDRASGFREELEKLVNQTPLVDTHEHLPDEEQRLRGEGVACDDWALLFSHYLDSDLISAGMTDAARRQFVSRGTAPADKWKLIAPFWPAVKNTGYGRAVRIAIQELYGIEDVDEKTAPRLQAAYEGLAKPGFYHKVLVERANIESCQVNCLRSVFRESKQPTLLMQDLSIVAMHTAPNQKGLSDPTGIAVRGLSDWHGVIRWWFDRYGPYATAVKSQAAYGRGLDYEQVPAEKAEPVFKLMLEKAPVTPEQKKLLEDHLFWYAVEQATRHELPVKLHTGYYAGQNSMPLGRVANNPAQAADLCRKSPDTRWVFMHIAYPYWQELLAVAKHYRNAHIDMCWAWIIDPIASTQFLQSCLMTMPANKVFVFGGDYIPVECVLGHARIARQGIVRALGELVDGGYLSQRDAMELVEPLLRGNARRAFQLEARAARLNKVPWL